MSSAFAISPDSQYVVFATDEVLYNAFELIRVPATGGAAKRISYPLSVSMPFTADGFPAVPHSFVVLTGSDSVLLRANRTLAHPNDFYRVPIEGGQAQAIGPRLWREQVDNRRSVSPDPTCWRPMAWFTEPTPKSIPAALNLEDVPYVPACMAGDIGDALGARFHIDSFS